MSLALAVLVIEADDMNSNGNGMLSTECLEEKKEQHTLVKPIS